MVMFNLCNQVIDFHSDISHIIEIREEFYRLSIDAENDFKSEYRSYGDLETAFKKTRSLGYKYIAKAIDKAIEIAIEKYDVYNLNRENFVEFDFKSPSFIESWSNTMTSFENLYLDLEEQCMAEEERRAFRKEMRGRIIGGGFGISGATKGILTAGAVNMATGLIHSAFNSIGNAITRSSINSEERKIYNDETILTEISNKLKEIINYIGLILWKMVLKIKHNTDSTDADLIQSIDIYRNIEDGLLSKEKIHEVLPRVIYDLWPFEPNLFKNVDRYDLSEEDEKILLEISNFLDINFAQVNTDFYVKEHRIADYYDQYVFDMFRGDLDGTYIVAYLVDEEEQNRLIEYLQSKNYKKIERFFRLKRLCDMELDDVPDEDISWLLNIIENVNFKHSHFCELKTEFHSLEIDKVLISILNGRLDKLYLNEVLWLGYQFESDIFHTLETEGFYNGFLKENHHVFLKKMVRMWVLILRVLMSVLGFMKF